MKGSDASYYRDWRTYQVSDHLPMWIELETDFSEQYLVRKADLEAPPTSIEDEIVTTMV
jgi:hypothetical protein